MKIKLSLFLIILLLGTNSYAANASTESLNKIYKNIKCLTCKGQSIYDSNASFADSMKSYIAEQYNLGVPIEDIEEDLVRKYGTEIILTPKKNNLLLWIAPPLILLLALCFIYKLAMVQTKRD